MASSMRQVMRQGQQLVMTQQLQQAIKLLQLSNLELTQFVEHQLESNPLLEMEEPRDQASSDERMDRTSNDPRDQGDPRSLASADPENSDAGAEDAPYENVFSNDDRDLAVGNKQAGAGTADTPSFSVSPARNTNDRGFDEDITARLSEAPNLREILHEQLALSISDVGEQMIGRYLIDTLDGSGYLLEDTDEIAERLGCDAAALEAVILQLQTFDPPGVFARSLSECLAIQLQDRDRLDPAMEALLENLDALGDGRLDWLRQRCKVDQEDFVEMLAELRALDPKPGLAFDTDPTGIVVPDVFVSRAQDGTWRVELNNDVLPRVLLNRQYYAEVKSAARNKDEKTYLSECFSEGSWLLKALDQRATTILKVSRELVRQQEGFFINGVSHLRPLNLRQIADAIGMHESTVSRVTANKYLSCTRGTFELKYFFTSAIASANGGEAHSAESVRQKIRVLIDAEDPKKILSDDRIVEMLRTEKVDIARRTVAKYREAMHIPSSVQRRRQKASL